MKTLSVITVTYNAEKTIERTLKSVAQQTYGGIDHIIMDGCSKDGTIDLAQQYQHTSLQIVSEPDKGLYDAMNKAVALAKGDYICFLNAGDTFYSDDTIEKMMKPLQADDILPDIIYGDTAIVDDKGVFLHMRRLRPPHTLTTNSFKKGMLVCHQAFIIKRTLFEPYDLQYRFSSDYDWSVRMVKKAYYIHNSRLVLINYLKGGLTTANHKASLKERYRIMVKHYGAFSTMLHHIWFAMRLLFK